MQNRQNSSKFSHMMLGLAGRELEKVRWNIFLFGVNLGKVLNYVLKEGRVTVTNGRVEASGGKFADIRLNHVHFLN